MKESDDKDLRSIFKELGNQAKKTSPSFGEIWAEVESNRRRRKRRMFQIRLAAAAVIGILVATTSLMPRLTQTRATVSEEWVISQWASPTDILLQSSLPMSLEEVDLLPTDALLEFSQINIPQDVNSPKDLN